MHLLFTVLLITQDLKKKLKIPNNFNKATNKQ